MPSKCILAEGSTTRPDLLTEADLVGLMDKHGIGTDATIAEHIAKIIEREYVCKHKPGGGANEVLVPSTLGIGLVEGYNAIGFEQSLCKPQMRAEVSATPHAPLPRQRAERQRPRPRSGWAGYATAPQRNRTW